MMSLTHLQTGYTETDLLPPRLLSGRSTRFGICHLRPNQLTRIWAKIKIWMCHSNECEAPLPNWTSQANLSQSWWWIWFSHVEAKLRGVCSMGNVGGAIKVNHTAHKLILSPRHWLPQIDNWKIEIIPRKVLIFICCRQNRHSAWFVLYRRA